MAQLRIPTFRHIGDAWDRVWDHWAGSGRHTVAQHKPRRLTFDPLEQRVLLSVSADPVTLKLSTGSTTQSTVGGQSVATDNAGDTVVVWTSTDTVHDPQTGHDISDQNVYADYLTHEYPTNHSGE